MNKLALLVEHNHGHLIASKAIATQLPGDGNT